jgi:hypothetical protein
MVEEAVFLLLLLVTAWAAWTVLTLMRRLERLESDLALLHEDSAAWARLWRPPAFEPPYV